MPAAPSRAAVDLDFHRTLRARGEESHLRDEPQRDRRDDFEPLGRLTLLCGSAVADVGNRQSLVAHLESCSSGNTGGILRAADQRGGVDLEQARWCDPRGASRAGSSGVPAGSVWSTSRLAGRPACQLDRHAG